MYTHTTELIQCSSLSLTNGMVDIEPTNRIVNSKATYVCNNGLRLDGNDERLCQMNGTWSGAEPICSENNFIHFINLVFVWT